MYVYMESLHTEFHIPSQNATLEVQRNTKRPFHKAFLFSNFRYVTVICILYIIAM
jgi:hypothetical protein